MTIRNIYLRGGTTAEHSAFTGADREITVDTTKKTLVVHDGTTAGGFPAATSNPTKLSELTDGAQLWKKSELTKVSQLTNDAGYWSGLSNVSQLTNDKGYKTSHCSYCSHCTYCSQCSRCNTVQCNQVQCTECNNCSHCTNCDCDCDCGDDNSCFVAGKFEIERGLIDVHDIRVGDKLVDIYGEAVRVVGVSHACLAGRRAISFGDGCLTTDDHPFLVRRGEIRELCACVGSMFDPNKIITGDNGVKGRYSETQTYVARFVPTLEKRPDTPTVCPIAEKEIIIKFGNGLVLIPGKL